MNNHMEKMKIKYIKIILYILYMEVIIFEGFWTIQDTRKLSQYIFIYGDNDIHKGKKGQAIIRDEPNAFGISTKKEPNNKSTSFYRDDEYDKNVIKINDAFENIYKHLNGYKGIILPKDGIGTGLARLNEFAPKTLAYINEKIQELIKTCSKIIS